MSRVRARRSVAGWQTVENRLKNGWHADTETPGA